MVRERQVDPEQVVPAHGDRRPPDDLQGRRVEAERRADRADGDASHGRAGVALTARDPTQDLGSHGGAARRDGVDARAVLLDLQSEASATVDNRAHGDAPFDQRHGGKLDLELPGREDRLRRDPLEGLVGALLGRPERPVQGRAGRCCVAHRSVRSTGLECMALGGREHALGESGVQAAEIGLRVRQVDHVVPDAQLTARPLAGSRGSTRAPFRRAGPRPARRGRATRARRAGWCAARRGVSRS